MVNMADLNYLLAQAVPTAVAQSEQALSGAAPPSSSQTAAEAAAQSMSSTGLNVALSLADPIAVEQSQQALSTPSYTPPPPSSPPPSATLGSSALEAPVLVETIVASGPGWEQTQEGANVTSAYDYLRTTMSHTLPAVMGTIEAHDRRLIRG